MRVYEAKLIGLSEIFEEEVTLKIGKTVIVGFATIYPYKITIGKSYPVEIELTFLDDEEFIEISESKHCIERIDNTYGYVLCGKIIDNSIDIGDDIKIYDDYFKENSYLLNKFVKAKVDRISISFLPRDTEYWWGQVRCITR